MSTDEAEAVEPVPSEVLSGALEAHMPISLITRLMAGEKVWSTEEALDEFEFIGFQAPYVVVKRRSDGVRGSLEFTHAFIHAPRFYFDWTEDQTT